MDSIPKNNVLTFHPDTVQSVRKIYDLDSPVRLEEAINIFQDWIQKQNHFTKKDFDRDFLERWIIINKGQLERAKTRLDKTCTLRTLMPEYFLAYNYKEDYKDAESIQAVILPKQTDDFYRIMLIKQTGAEISSTIFYNHCRKGVILSEYLIKHDYSTGFVIVFDLRNTNIMDYVTKISITELRQTATLYLQGYGTRIKGIHIISSSKYVEGLILLFKQVVSAKVGERIHSHATMESLHTFVPKDLLPGDYGGNQESFSDLKEKWTEVLTSDEHIEYMKKMHEARTDESQRNVDTFNEQHLGTPGSFRTLIVD